MKRREFALTLPAPAAAAHLPALAQSGKSSLVLGMTLEPTSEGLRVTRVQPGSPAMEQGMEEGDVIVEINRQAVKSLDDVKGAVENRADRGHFIKFLRDGREQVMILTR